MKMPKLRRSVFIGVRYKLFRQFSGDLIPKMLAQSPKITFTKAARWAILTPNEDRERTPFPRDHSSRSEHTTWGFYLVAGLGSQIRVFRGYRLPFPVAALPRSVFPKSSCATRIEQRRREVAQASPPASELGVPPGSIRGTGGGVAQPSAAASASTVPARVPGTGGGTPPKLAGGDARATFCDSPCRVAGIAVAQPELSGEDAKAENQARLGIFMINLRLPGGFGASCG